MSLRPRSTTSWAVLFAACAVASCVYEPTQVRVLVDTDLPVSDTISLRVVAQRAAGESTIDGGSGHSFRHGPDAGDAGFSFPASFAIVPAAGEPHDDAVFLLVEIDDGSIVLRRNARFRFVPGRSQLLRLFLSTRCLAMTGTCNGAPCPVARECDLRGQTCDELGRCVDSAVTLTGGREFGGADANDLSSTDAVNDIVSDILSDTVADAGPPCGDHVCSGDENACNCGADCMPRAGDACCSPGETNCSESACAAAPNDGCCSPGENPCSEGACPVVNQDGCCSPGENNCNEGACPVVNQDGCCSPGENNCSEGACPVANQDGCCSPGETNCNEGACAPACGDGCCTGGETCRTCRGDCGGSACDCYLRCCDGQLFGPMTTDSAGDCTNQYAVCTSYGSHTYRAERGGICVYGRHASPCPAPDCSAPYTTSCTTAARYCSTSNCNTDCP